MSEDNVRVAVRVRPFNQREIDRKSKCIIHMDGQRTKIVNPADGKSRAFSFDFSYWSHKNDSKFAGQQTVFNDLGIGVLESAWKGYNVSLFAYGQTGSGKSYSMVGYGEERGIIPLACEELFVRVSKNDDPDLRYKVETSMLEIYNEQVRDLFNPKSYKPGGLRVRENPKTGPYVEDLALLQVEDYVGIDKLMEEGSRARTVASTNMNATSSRAHTIFTIIFTQIRHDPVVNKDTSKVSKISLVDLAGSERAESTGATGDRLKEGANINKSLSSLGNCISALAENSSGPKKKKFVPYRDSVLTWLLKESLGGNARTIMIAALSPADINFDETLSTLRYADRAKQIKNNAIVNEDPNAKLIRELRAEIDLLKSQIGGNTTTTSAAGLTPEMEEEMKKLREQYEESQKLISQLSMSDDDKRRQTDEINNSRQATLQLVGFGEGSKNDTPHFLNLNEDPQLSGSLCYFFKVGDTKFGRRSKDNPPDVQLSGLSILKEHCIVTRTDDNSVTVCPIENARVFVNGVQVGVGENKELIHHCRVILGNNHLFRFVHPLCTDGADVSEDVIDWDFAQKEFAEAQGRTISLEVDGNAEKEVEEMKKKLEEEKRKQMEELEQQKKQLDEMAKKMAQEMAGETSQKEIAKAREELEKKNRELQEKLQKQEELAKELTSRKARERRERSLLEENLLKTIPMVNEANQIAEELHKDMHFEIKLLAVIHKVADMSLPEDLRYQKSTEIRIRVTRISDMSSLFMWDLEKFTNRVYLMREVYQNYLDAMDNVESYDVDCNGDPFYDPPQEQLVGTAMVYLASLAHLLESELSTPVLDYKGKQEGELQVDIFPCDDKGDPDGIDDYVEEAEELIGRRVDFLIRIPHARGLPPRFANNTFVSYKFFLEEEKYNTNICDKKTINPEFKYSKQVTMNPATADFIKYLETEAIQFEVYGTPEVDPDAPFMKGIHYHPGEDAAEAAAPSSLTTSSGGKGETGAKPTGSDGELKRKVIELQKQLQDQIKKQQDMIKKHEQEMQKLEKELDAEKKKKKSKSCIII